VECECENCGYKRRSSHDVEICEETRSEWYEKCPRCGGNMKCYSVCHPADTRGFIGGFGGLSAALGR